MANPNSYDESGNDVMWFWSENHALFFTSHNICLACFYRKHVLSPHPAWNSGGRFINVKMKSMKPWAARSVWRKTRLSIIRWK